MPDTLGRGLPVQTLKLGRAKANVARDAFCDLTRRIAWVRLVLSCKYVTNSRQKAQDDCALRWQIQLHKTPIHLGLSDKYTPVRASNKRPSLTVLV